MSNYPPGVTGNEPQIAGPGSAGMRSVECDNESHFFVSTHVVMQVNQGFERLVTGGLEGNWDEVGIERWKQNTLAALTEHMIEHPCEWEGEVELEVWGHGVGVWNCPRCDKEHEIDLAEEAREDAADMARDRMIEGEFL